MPLSFDQITVCVMYCPNTLFFFSLFPFLLLKSQECLENGQDFPLGLKDQLTRF